MLHQTIPSDTLMRRFDADSRPGIIVLCGSSRFYDEYQRANYALTMAGYIVLGIGHYPHSLTEAGGHGEGVGHDSEQKVALDELHKHKITLADRVVILNVGGYVGASTLSEINHAIALSRPVDFLEDGHTWGGVPEGTLVPGSGTVTAVSRKPHRSYVKFDRTSVGQLDFGGVRTDAPGWSEGVNEWIAGRSNDEPVPVGLTPNGRLLYARRSRWLSRVWQKHLGGAE